MFTSGRAFEQIGFRWVISRQIGAARRPLGRRGWRYPPVRPGTALLYACSQHDGFIPSGAVEAEAAVRLPCLHALVAFLFLCSIPTLITTLRVGQGVLFSKGRRRRFGGAL